MIILRKKQHYKQMKLFKKNICILFIFFSCTNKQEFYFCNDIKCSSGKYIIKEYSKGFLENIKDSTRYTIKQGSDNNFSEDSFHFIDSLMDFKNYITEKEKALLKKTNVTVENIKGKWVDEYCINYEFNFKGHKELKNYRVAYFKFMLAFNLPLLEALPKKNNEMLDTLKNVKLMRKLLAKQIDYFSLEKGKFCYINPSKQSRGSILISFPKAVKNIDISGLEYRLINDRETIMIYDTIKKNKTDKDKILIGF